MESPSPPDAPSSPPEPTTPIHPIIRNALRISLSTDEYKSLHQRLPASVKGHALSPSRFRASVPAEDQFNEATIRASLRVFLGSATAFKLIEFITGKIAARRGVVTPPKPKVSRLQSTNFRASLSLSLILFLHRILHRFFFRLRANLRTDDARPFRERNPRISRALTSKYAPAVGASLAGFALGAYPQSQLRLTVAIYMSTRSLEFLYNALEQKGWFKNRPWWFGSWLLMPVSFAQLFHAFIFDRETGPKWFGDFILKFAPAYFQERPGSFPAERHWPNQYETVDALGRISELKWPAFISPILHPSKPQALPDVISMISPITSPAHPSIASLSCALLHPKSPSCLTAFIHQNLLSIPILARFLTKLYLAFAILKFKSFLSHPIVETNTLCRKILSMTAVLSASLGSAWGSICLFNSYLPRSILPTQRFYLSGALAGLPFMFLARGANRGASLYFLRMAIDSAWKTGEKHRLWRLWKGGDLCVIVASWALIGALLDNRPDAVDAKGFRKMLMWVRGDGYIDPAESGTKKKGKKATNA
ncbi:hypothetical protein AJ80_03320 [Polytolypa hystricis UAMH7299]|uniref:Transmembrane protein 135 N-terminal domain-containing protein n=1 Tax=Polytolypa hystricis (strain UAMH7299) TaxID=1447883 RepID=A0A2B7YK72_POLH7|nr:hypothetical protein AJ80_03320 [Polytolypa hystricis UAMH7299]